MKFGPHCVMRLFLAWLFFATAATGYTENPFPSPTVIKSTKRLTLCGPTWSGQYVCGEDVRGSGESTRFISYAVDPEARQVVPGSGQRPPRWTIPLDNGRTLLGYRPVNPADPETLPGSVTDLRILNEHGQYLNIAQALGFSSVGADVHHSLRRSGHSEMLFHLDNDGAGPWHSYYSFWKTDLNPEGTVQLLHKEDESLIEDIVLDDGSILYSAWSRDVEPRLERFQVRRFYPSTGAEVLISEYVHRGNVDPARGFVKHQGYVYFYQFNDDVFRFDPGTNESVKILDFRELTGVQLFGIMTMSFTDDNRLHVTDWRYGSHEFWSVDLNGQNLRRELESYSSDSFQVLSNPTTDLYVLEADSPRYQVCFVSVDRANGADELLSCIPEAESVSFLDSFGDVSVWAVSPRDLRDRSKQYILLNQRTGRLGLLSELLGSLSDTISWDTQRMEFAGGYLFVGQAGAVPNHYLAAIGQDLQIGAVLKYDNLDSVWQVAKVGEYLVCAPVVTGKAGVDILALPWSEVTRSVGRLPLPENETVDPKYLSPNWPKFRVEPLGKKKYQVSVVMDPVEGVRYQVRYIIRAPITNKILKRSKKTVPTNELVLGTVDRGSRVEAKYRFLPLVGTARQSKFSRPSAIRVR